MKECHTCQVTLPLSWFNRGDGKCGVRGSCIPCTRVLRKGHTRRKHDPIARRKVSLKYNTGLTVEQFDRRRAEQGGACAVCRVIGEEQLCVDHDHSCCPGVRACGACVRGLLCRSCNTAAGHMRDNPDNIRALAAYIERTKSGNPHHGQGKVHG